MEIRNIYSFLIRREKWATSLEWALWLNHQRNKCSVTFIAIERLWHRIKDNKDMCWFSFYSFWFFLSFSFFNIQCFAFAQVHWRWWHALHTEQTNDISLQLLVESWNWFWNKIKIRYFKVDIRYLKLDGNAHLSPTYKFGNKEIRLPSWRAHRFHRISLQTLSSWKKIENR